MRTRLVAAPSRLALGALAWATLVVGCRDGVPPATALPDDVDPFVGTGGHGHVYPGATVPWGMVQLSPDNGRGGWDWVAGYHWSDSVIVGFSHTHLSGTGIGDLLDVLVAPVVGAVELGEGPTPGPGPEGSDARLAVAWASRFRHTDERAEPGYYRVRLADSDIEVELTATTRVGLHRYVFPDAARAADARDRRPAEPDGPGPAGEPGNVGLVVDLGYARNWDTPVDASVRLVDDTLLLGHRRSTGWARDQRVFFAMALSRPVARAVAAGSGATRRELPVPGGSGGGPAAGPGASAPFSDSLARALLLFDRRHGDTLLVKVGLSHVSERGALDNLRAEAPGWDFDGARRAARAAWAGELGKVRVGGGREGDRRTFYTALYRTRVCPVVFEDASGLYRGADGAVRRADGYTRHAIFSLWDTFRTQHPLMTLIDRDRVPDLVRTMVAFQRESGVLPIWSLLGNETNTMTGHHGVPVVVDAALKGLSPLDPGEVFEAVRVSTEADHRALPLYREYGWIPADLEVESVTKTLEYAFDDWAASRLAEALGRDEAATRWRERAGWWRNVFDPETRFMRGRLADGSWREPFDPFHASHREDTDFTEGNAWQHTWFVPHDVRGLIDAMGGDDAFVRKLDSLFEADTVVTGENVSPDISGLIGQYAHGNEPSHHIAYLHHWAGRPWRSADRVRQILATQYGDRPDGLAGNEDCGQMSAWYVASAVGLYPVDPAGGTWVIGSPLFEEAVLDVGGGRTFTVRAPGASDSLRYVRAARLDGEPLERSWLHQGEVVEGGVLELEMSAEPGGTWGTARESRPPSMSDELSPYPPATLPASASPAPSGRPVPPDTVRRPVRSASGLAPDTTSARRVRDAFLHAWNGYLEHARGHDALRPLSLAGRDWYDASLVMTPLDAYDTMLLMGLDAQAAEARELILEGLDFDRDFSVQVFEVTIRLLGGLLSAYQMDGDPRFLSLATDLGDRLLPAFDSPTGMPYVNVNLRTGEPSGAVSNPAEIGTLVLELGTLSELTGDPRYYEAAKRGMREVFERRSGIGLVGTTIDVETGEWVRTTSHVSGRIDSWYEYLLKAWLLFGDDDFRRMWEASVGPLHRYLADEVEGRLWYGEADMATGERTATRFGALDAFLPAVLALSGDLDRGGRLMESVHRMWTEYDLEPERFDYVTGEILSPGYVLRPEALESAYYMYRLTGDERWRDAGRDIFDRIERWARTDEAFAHLRSVVTKEKSDGMQSFFLAETLKYAWLLFAPPEALDFDAVVFNTEAHPLRRTW